MLASISWKQFNEWAMYAELEPFGEERADIRAGSIVKMLYDLFGRKRGQSTRPLTDFIVKFGDQPASVSKKKSWQEMKMIGQMMAIASQDSRRDSS